MPSQIHRARSICTRVPCGHLGSATETCQRDPILVTRLSGIRRLVSLGLQERSPKPIDEALSPLFIAQTHKVGGAARPSRDRQMPSALQAGERSATQHHHRGSAAHRTERLATWRREACETTRHRYRVCQTARHTSNRETGDLASPRGSRDDAASLSGLPDGTASSSWLRSTSNRETGNLASPRGSQDDAASLSSLRDGTASSSISRRASNNDLFAMMDDLTLHLCPKLQGQTPKCSQPDLPCKKGTGGLPGQKDTGEVGGVPSYVFLHTYIPLYTNVHVYIHTSIYIYRERERVTCTYTYIHISISIEMFAYKHAYTHGTVSDAQKGNRTSGRAEGMGGPTSMIC